MARKRQGDWNISSCISRNRVDRIIVLLSELLAKRDQWLHPIVSARRSADLRVMLETALRGVVKRHLAIALRAPGR